MGKKVIKIFILTTIIVMLFIIGVLAVYIFRFKDISKHTQNEASNIKKETKYEKNGVLYKSLPNVEKEKVIRGVVFIGDKEDEKLISSAYFVDFSKKENKISFYNIPGDMMFEVSNELYKDISTSLADIPQVVKLSHLYKYSKSKQGLKAGMLMLENYLELGISHYLFLSSEDAEKIFYFNEKGDSTFLQSFVYDIINGSNKNKSQFVASVYNYKFTDIKKKAYVNILKKLKDVKTENIKFTTIKGEKFDNGVVINKKMISQSLSSKSE